MEVEKFRGYITTLTAAVLAVGAPAMAAWAWIQPIDPENPRDLAIIFGLIGIAFGAASAWLFGAESASRATHAAERSFTSGQFAGSALPEQAAAATPLAPLVMNTEAVRTDDDLAKSYEAGWKARESHIDAAMLDQDREQGEPDRDERGSDVQNGPPAGGIPEDEPAADNGGDDQDDTRS
jgi:hypothetical protein